MLHVPAAAYRHQQPQRPDVDAPHHDLFQHVRFQNGIYWLQIYHL
jgi:hypothetical protein